MRAEEARALHDLGPHERGSDQRREAVGDRLVEGHVHERELEPGADALQEVEPGAGHLGPARHVDRVEQLADLEVIARLEAECGDLTHLAQHVEVVLAAGGDALDDHVAELLHRGGERLLGGRGIGVGLLDLGRELLRLCDQGGLLVLRGLRDLLAERVLLGAQRLERRDGGTTRGICGDRVVDEGGGLPARLLRALDQVGVLAEQHGVDHSSKSRACHPCPTEPDRATHLPAGAHALDSTHERGQR
jgi:hypothetical protein